MAIGALTKEPMVPKDAPLDCMVDSSWLTRSLAIFFCKRVKDLIIKFSHGERRPRVGARTGGEKESDRGETWSHPRMLRPASTSALRY